MKKVIIGIVAVIVVVIAAALAAPFLIPTDTYKNRVIALVKQSTGRDLRIDGPVRLSLLPQLEVDASGVTLANAPGASDPDMMRLKKLEVQLNVLPLLHGTIELGRFVLTEPVISLEVDKAGRPNWIFASAAPASSPAPRQGGAAPAPAPMAASPAPGGAGSRSASFSELRLDDVRLVDGKITYRDDRTGKVEELDAIAMKLSLPNLDSPFASDGSAVWNGKKVALSLGVAKPRALLGGAQSGLSIHLVAQPINFGFTGDATGLPPARLAGAVDLTVPSLRDLAKWVGTPLPPGGGLGHVAIKGKLDMQGPKIVFSDAAIGLDAINAQGTLAVDTSGARPALSGKLQVDKLDLNPYLPPETTATKGASAPAAARSGSGGAPAPASAAAGWSDAPLDLSALHAADADLDLSTGAIDYRKIVIGPSALDLHLKDAKLAVDLTQIPLYQGKGQGKVALDGSGAVPAMTLAVNLSGIEIGPLLKAAADNDRLSGTGKLSFDVAGSGKSQRALVSALNGKGALDLANGQIKGVNLIALAENPTSVVTGAKDQNKTDFGSLTGTFTITNGILHNDDLQLKSGPIPVTGAGTVSLPARTVNYRVTVNLAGSIGVPVLVSGPWDNLSYRPDLSSLARDPGKLLNTLKNFGAGAGGGSGGGSGAGGSSSTSNPASILKGLLGH